MESSPHFVVFFRARASFSPPAENEPPHVLTERTAGPAASAASAGPSASPKRARQATAGQGAAGAIARRLLARHPAPLFPNRAPLPLPNPANDTHARTDPGSAGRRGRAEEPEARAGELLLFVFFCRAVPTAAATARSGSFASWPTRTEGTNLPQRPAPSPKNNTTTKKTRPSTSASAEASSCARRARTPPPSAWPRTRGAPRRS